MSRELPPSLTNILTQINALKAQLANLDRLYKRKEPPCFSSD